MTLHDLLQTVLDKGWVAFGKYKNAQFILDTYSINELCSIDSGLRQFLCGLDKSYLPFCSKCYIRLESENDKIKSNIRYEEEVNYRLMLSSIQEDKTKFLLDNISLSKEPTPLG